MIFCFRSDLEINFNIYYNQIASLTCDNVLKSLKYANDNLKEWTNNNKQIEIKFSKSLEELWEIKAICENHGLINSLYKYQKTNQSDKLNNNEFLGIAIGPIEKDSDDFKEIISYNK